MMPEVGSPEFEPGYAPVAASGAQDDASSLVFPFVGTRLLIDSAAELPRPEILRGLGEALRTFRFGTLAGRACILEVRAPRLDIPRGLRTGDYRELWDCWPPGRLSALVRARQLAAWALHNRFCGVCGHATELGAADIACVCPVCGEKAYPRISPVAIGLVLRGDELLLARSPHFAPGMYSAIAGFVEAGESAEECLRREAREEAGIEIRNIRYFGTQSWPYPHSLMIGFIADYHSGELSAQKDEIEDLGWFRFDSLPVRPHPGSLARRMIESVCAALAEKAASKAQKP
jgi:NAD+ diphosphatase